LRRHVDVSIGSEVAAVARVSGRGIELQLRERARRSAVLNRQPVGSREAARRRRCLHVIRTPSVGRQEDLPLLGDLLRA
jgi:hypothetical protein